MIVQQHHEKMCHQNAEATIGSIRSKFWITNLRRLLRRVVSKCNVCKLRKARPTQPEMGPLPADRLEANGWPFKFTGLDNFGPLFVSIGRRTEKRWVALFTCLTTRAIHLEMAHDLSTDSCIIAMRNFMSRRGPVVRIRSDNGKNFVGADREAKRFSEVVEPAQIQGELSSKGVEWIFNCPANPAEGGAWERMVQCVKKVLAHTMKELAPKEHVMENLLIEAESIVNTRPLTHLPVTVDQEAPLTPNDLLKGASGIPDLPKDDGQEPVRSATRKQWRIARMMRDRFWKRWVHEYLPTLVRREKWCKRVEPIRRAHPSRRRGIHLRSSHTTKGMETRRRGRGVHREGWSTSSSSGADYRPSQDDYASRFEASCSGRGECGCFTGVGMSRNGLGYR
ncbi:uncharacterized protein LOC121529829 [Drosophila eugracilis]|uniref:uncharacterized protein LOC121529829 n=1 Tax=Drosophila eugracilis TaxID=29029 RepID=UPI001BD97C34|nr:uncharacterized protein LOC121529829 [Drosophila eugracilis]